MLERVERVMGIKRVKFNNDELFERRKGFEEKEERGAFASIFEDEMQKKRKKSDDDVQPKRERNAAGACRSGACLCAR